MNCTSSYVIFLKNSCLNMDQSCAAGGNVADEYLNRMVASFCNMANLIINKKYIKF